MNEEEYRRLVERFQKFQNQYRFEREAVVPDMLGPIVACRVFKIRPVLGKHLLSVGVGNTIYHDAGPLVAECVDPFYRGRFCLYGTPPPNPLHTCGWYAKNNWRSLFNEFDHIVPPRRVYGTVELWGRVIPGSFGWRAQYLRIRALDSKRYARLYRVPHLTEYNDDELTKR